MATWYDWNNTDTTPTMTVWNEWTTTDATTNTADRTWYYWTDGDSGFFYQKVTDQQWGQPPPTPEEIEVSRILAEKREQERIEAEVRAEKILAENLDEEQKKVYAERKVVPITTAKGRKYLIKKGRAGNVYRIDEHGKEIEKFCIHPDELVPDQDTMLSQLLWLRWCEDDFLRIANMTRLAA